MFGLFEPETQEVFDLMPGISNGKPFSPFFILRSLAFFPYVTFSAGLAVVLSIVETEFVDI